MTTATMAAASKAYFDRKYETHLKHLKLKGLQPKTIDAYSRAIRRIFAATRKVSYRVFFFTLYSLGLRLGEGLRLQIGDIDATRGRVHIRDAKGNRDRLVPLPDATLALLRQFWPIHRNPVLMFPNRHAGRNGATAATTPLDRGGVQVTLRKVVLACGLKKRSRRTAFATAMQLI